jgi:phytoene dehydrogenase-like protein
MGDDYEYWKALKQRDINEYNAEKEKLARDVIDRIAELYPETKDKFEVFDVATPVTYERYCGAYRGAWMGFDMIPKVKNLRHKGIF